MVSLDLFTVPLDFLLILLVNGNPAAECVPMVIAQDMGREAKTSYLHCRTTDGEEFGTQASILMRTAPELLGTEDNDEITLQLAAR